MTPAERDEMEILRETIRQLRALKLPRQAQYFEFGFNRTERVILAAIMNTDVLCTRDYLLDCITFSRVGLREIQPKTVDIMICHIRKKIIPMGFAGAIQNVWGEGWWIPDTEVKTRMKDFFALGQPMGVLHDGQVLV